MNYLELLHEMLRKSGNDPEMVGLVQEAIAERNMLISRLRSMENAHTDAMDKMEQLVIRNAELRHIVRQQSTQK